MKRRVLGGLAALSIIFGGACFGTVSPASAEVLPDPIHVFVPVGAPQPVSQGLPPGARSCFLIDVRVYNPLRNPPELINTGNTGYHQECPPPR